MEKTTGENNSNQGAKKSEVESGKGMAILAYFGILALIPYFAEKNNKFVRFHAVQGMNLLLIWVAYGILSGIISSVVWSATVGNCVSSIYGGYGAGCTGGFGVASIVSMLIGLIWMGLGVIAIIGIVNAATGKEKEVPVLGKIKIIKS